MKDNYTPGIISLLPLFYVGWSDSVLGPSEQHLILDKINRMPHLTYEEKQTLAKWTDQQNPPTAEDYKNWILHIRHFSENLNDEEKNDLISLGIAMARQASSKNANGHLDSPDVIKALEALEQTLGLEEHLNESLLFHTIDPSKHPNPSIHHSVTAEALAKHIEGAYPELASKVKTLLKDPFFKNEDIRNKEEYRAKILAQTKELANQNLSRLFFPKEYGGGDNPMKGFVVFETLAHGDLSLMVKFGVQFGLFGGAVNLLGTKKHHEKYLRDLGKLELAGCFAMTETGHGSNVRGLTTTATYDENTDSFIINSPFETSGKEYIGNAMHSTIAVVFAQLWVSGINHGVHALLVPLRDASHSTLPGIRIEDNGYKMGLNGVDNGRIWFDQVSIPRENLLDKYGQVSSDGEYSSSIKSDGKRFFTMLGALVAGRVSIACASNNATKNALTIAIRYALKRRQFSQSRDEEEVLIMDYPTHQKRLFPRLAKTYALHFALEQLKEMYSEQVKKGDMRKVESLAAGLKSVASWHASDTIQECREACGGKGYLNENAFADLKADTDIFTTFEGDNHVLLQLVSKGLLTEFKEQFQDGGFYSIIRHLTNRLSTNITEANPYTIRNTNSEHLLSEEFHLTALEYRENSLLFSLANRMRDFIKRRLNPNETFQLIQNHMVSLAIASMESYIAKAFYTAVNKIEHNEEQALYRRLARLYSLDTIYSHRGWFLESDYISGGKSKAIRKQISALNKKVRQDARLYVNAFQIPDDLMRAKII